MRTAWILVSALILGAGTSQAQDAKLVADKQGSFKIIDWGIYTHFDCGFTKTETDAHAQKIRNIIGYLREKNLVLKETKGFMGQATLFAKDCDRRADYGIPGSIRFEFCAFFLNKEGKEVYSTIEPPSWYLLVNVMDKKDTHIPPRPPKSEPVKPGFDYDTYKAAAEKLNELFYTRDVRQVIAPGLDRYGDEVVVYNPDRPPYWLQVTVEEAYQRHFAYWKAAPDKVQSDLTLQMLKQEYETFTEEERKGYAYAMGKGAVAGVGNDPKAPALVRANPDYWNKKLPKSSIQFLNFILPANQKYLQNRAEEWLKKSNISYYEALFEATLDIRDFPALIDK